MRTCATENRREIGGMEQIEHSRLMDGRREMRTELGQSICDAVCEVSCRQAGGEVLDG